MGFKNTEPSYPGMAATALLTVGHFAAIPVMTRFEANALPWKQDSDKSDSQLYLQRFLWASVPLTFTAGYWDQLAVQYNRARVLPPMFEERNAAAGFFSLLFPGGGLFYKGRRVEGWTYYASEMALAAYASYNWQTEKGKWALPGLVWSKVLNVCTPGLPGRAMSSTIAKPAAGNNPRATRLRPS
jgi:hypothetical protein